MIRYFIPLIVLFLLMIGFRPAKAQSCTVMGSSIVCPNDQANYFVTGCTSCNYAIVSVDGNPTRVGSQITWNVQGRTAGYDILFQAPGCSNIIKTVFVQPPPTVGTTSPLSQSICQGQSASSITVSFTGGSISWEKRTPGGSWFSISGTAGLNPITSAYIDNTATYEYRMAVTQCSQTAYSSTATVNVTSLTAPPTPTNGDVTTNCGVFEPIGISTNYTAGYTIRHYYYDHIGALLPEQTVSNPTGTAYVSQYTPTASNFNGSSSTMFQVEAEVIVGNCSQKSGRKTFTYTLGTVPQPPSSLIFTFNSSPKTSINVCAGETINLTASGGSSNFNWFKPSGGTSFNNSSELTAFMPVESGPYLVTSTWTNPCGGTSAVNGTIVINVFTPSLQLSDPGANICSNTPPTITSTVSSGASNVSYQWILSNGSTGSASSFAVPSGLPSGPYTLNCTVTANFTGTCQGVQTLQASRTFQITAFPSTPPTPSNADYPSPCGVISPIHIATNYPAGYTIKHNYYDHLGNLIITQTATHPNSSGIYESDCPLTASSFGGASSATFQLEAEVVGGGCSLKSGRKTFTYTLGSGPQPPSSLTFTFNSSPVISINVCSGETINLTASGGSSNYNWYKPSGGASFYNSSSLSNYTPPESGTYTVTATWANPCGGSSTVQGTFVINKTTPTVQISNPGSSFCKGSTPSFSATLSSGSSNVSYSWTLGSSTGSASSFIIPATTIEDTYSLNLSVSADFTGVCQTRQTLSSSKSIQILPAPTAPTVTGNTRFGAGSLTLTASGIFPLPADYNWYASSGITHGNTLPLAATQPMADYVTVKAVGSNACEGTGTTVSIIVLPLPTIQFVGPSYVPLGGNTTLTTEVYDAYVWKNSLDQTLGTSQTLSVSQPETYHVVVTKSGVSETALIKVGDNLTDPGHNYVQEETILKEGVVSESTISTLSITERSQNVQYLDGLGRPMQTISTQGSPLKNDIVQVSVYDALGRESIKYLPYVDQEKNGRLKSNTLANQATFYNGSNQIPSDASPFSQITFEPSPLNRVTKQGAPGAAWQPVNPSGDIYSNNDNTIKKRYQTNQANEVLLFTYDAATGLTAASTGTAPLYYAPNQLQVNLTLDEHNNEVIEYTDKEAHVVCKKVYAETINSVKQYACTYYVYDNYGNLVVVLPPEAIKSALTVFTQDLR